MISWIWLIPALVAGAVFGFFVASVVSTICPDDEYNERQE